jgi:hypothetical protein
MKFRLQKSSGSNDVITKFDVVDDNESIVGRICVPREASADLLAHWNAAPSPSSTAARGKNPVVNAMLAAKRPGALAPAVSKPNPAVAAMLRVSRQNKLTKQAVLRGC